MLPARGNYSDLAANVAALLDGEICYAIDQDQYYQKEGSVLVSVGATKAQGLLADSALQDAPSDGSEYVRKNGTWAVSTGGGGGGATTIDGLTDVDTSSVAPTDGQALVWSATDSEWQPGTVAGGGGATSLDGLSDVDLSTPATTGDVLLFDGSQFTAFAGDQLPNSIGAQPRTTYVLTANGTTSYLFAGPGFLAPTPNPELTLVRGQTYVFSNTTGQHPFQIQTEGGAAYDSGVTNNNTIGDVIFVVPMDAPSSLKYQCTSHASMNGDIKLLDAGPAVASTGDLTDVDETVTPNSGDVLTYDGSKYVPSAPAGGGGSTYTSVTVPVADIIASHTFGTDYDDQVEVNFANWTGSQGTEGYGPSRKGFWDFSISNTEASQNVVWPASTETSGLHISFSIRWPSPATGTGIPRFIMGIGSDAGLEDGTVGGFAVLAVDGAWDRPSWSGVENFPGPNYIEGSFIYLCDLSGSNTGITGYLVGTGNLNNVAIEDTQPYYPGSDNTSYIDDGRWHQIDIIIHTDEAGDADGRFSMYVDGVLVDQLDRTVTPVNGNTGPLTQGGGNFDRLFLGAPKNLTADQEWQIRNLYLTGKETVKYGTDGIEVIPDMLWNSYYTRLNPILTERTFVSPTSIDTYLGSLNDVSSRSPIAHGQGLAWNSRASVYEPMDTAVVRNVTFDSGYGAVYPYQSNQRVWDDMGVGNIMINVGSGKMCIWTGEEDPESGEGGWMEWSINPIFAA